MHSWLLVAHLGQLDLEKPGLHRRSRLLRGGRGGGSPCHGCCPLRFYAFLLLHLVSIRFFFKQAIFGCFLFLTQCQRSLLH